MKKLNLLIRKETIIRLIAGKKTGAVSGEEYYKGFTAVPADFTRD